MNFEECKVLLANLDRQTLVRRAKRRSKLKQITTGSRGGGLKSESDYTNEASDCFINGDFRCTIFSAACAIEQIMRFEYLKEPRNKHKDIDKLTFGQLINKCENNAIDTLAPFIPQAKLLNNMRNVISVHPLFIDLPIESTEVSTQEELIRRDMKELIKLVHQISPNNAKSIRSTELWSYIEKKSYILGNVMDGISDMPSSIDGFWALVQNNIFEELALEAWDIIKFISEGLYGVQD